ncbi:PCOC1 endopeptidase, partial [Campylorhamphus procurvoides]|nr:PCOC1 endopeptidase [Campylorhamphus procurvoides]
QRGGRYLGPPDPNQGSLTPSPKSGQGASKPFWGVLTPFPPFPPPVLTGTVKSVSRGPPTEPGWAVLSVLSLPKAGALGVPDPPKGAALRLQLPCRLCPALKKGSTYVLMGKLGEDGGALLPPDAFVVPFRPQQQQLLANLSKRPCRGSR